MTTPDSPRGYPLLLDLAGRRAVVVGGGPVAARRARGLIDAAADVHVVAPFICEDLWDAAEAGQLTVHVREFEIGDLDDVWLVHTATGDRFTDDLVADETARRHVWCVRADNATRSSAWTPAVARIGDVVVAVNTGADPRRAVSIRECHRQQLSTGALPLGANVRPQDQEASRLSVVAPETRGSSLRVGASSRPRLMS